MNEQEKLDRKNIRRWLAYEFSGRRIVSIERFANLYGEKRLDFVSTNKDLVFNPTRDELLKILDCMGLIENSPIRVTQLFRMKYHGVAFVTALISCEDDDLEIGECLRINLKSKNTGKFALAVKFYGIKNGIGLKEKNYV